MQIERLVHPCTGKGATNNIRTVIIEAHNQGERGGDNKSPSFWHLNISQTEENRTHFAPWHTSRAGVESLVHIYIFSVVVDPRTEPQHPQGKENARLCGSQWVCIH